jgi:hypothetical protein
VPRILERWHLLSLDAPTVAALWSWFFAQAVHIDLPWHAPLLLALGTWLIYVADRILDGTRSGASKPLRERHYFHANHRKAFLIASAAVGCTLLWLIIARMSANARFEDTILFAAALLYLVLIHKPRVGGTSWLPKELAVGIVFAAASAVPAWSRLNSSRDGLFPAIALFAALCWLNCVAIERWENLTPQGQLQPADAHRTTEWAASHFQGTAAVLALISMALAVVSQKRLSPVSSSGALYLAAAISALALGLIDRRRKDFSALQLRIAADLALLTPIVFLPFLK